MPRPSISTRVPTGVVRVTHGERFGPPTALPFASISSSRSARPKVLAEIAVLIEPRGLAVVQQFMTVIVEAPARAATRRIVRLLAAMRGDALEAGTGK